MKVRYTDDSTEGLKFRLYMFLSCFLTPVISIWKQGSLNHQVDNYPHTTPFRVLGMLDLIFSCSTQIRFVRFHSIRSQSSIKATKYGDTKILLIKEEAISFFSIAKS